MPREHQYNLLFFELTARGPELAHKLLFSQARLRGFEHDLGLTEKQFDTILSILYVGYILMQVPS